ncbi:hypothetical protein [Halosimplex pelagicum]|uniref:Uncharacterized protein n=1 Tax=Halosimplex pelagicum TaxID=869886 RepID=A0A7D5PEF8_9EURY|nr:hypothetical protein [Halosimplex pelagicum]QLH82000.1 hypothetical protein HZS54_10380 [Halosimplex pelagicum]
MVAQCPYCSESKSDNGLRGHILLENDTEHGPLGQFPADYESANDVDEWSAIRDIGSDDTESEEKSSGLLGGLLG